MINLARQPLGYVSVTPDPKFRKWLIEALDKLGIVNYISSRELHCTLAYDESNPMTVPDMLKHWDFKRKFSAEVTGIQFLGDSLVLMLRSKDLTKRFKELQDIGFKYTYPEYLPHISIKVDASEEDLHKLSSDTFISGLRLVRKITLSGEQWEPLTK